MTTEKRPSGAHPVTTPRDPLPRLVALVVAASQILWLIGSGTGIGQVILGVLLLILAALLFARSSSQAVDGLIVAIVAFGGTALMASAVLGMDAPVPLRLPFVFVGAASVAAGLAGLVVMLRGCAYALPLTVFAILLAPFVVTEVVLSAGPPPLVADASLEMVRPPLPNDAAGYRPLSRTVVEYPDPLGGYLRASNAVEASWGISTADTNNAARIVSQATDSVLAVAIDRASGGVSWNIQLWRQPTRLEAGKSYQLTFGARSNVRRSMGLVVTMGREPWTQLALGEGVELDTTWRRFNRRFVPSLADSGARVRFDLSSSTGTVFLRDVVVQERSGPRVDILGEIEYALEYRFDSLGCRSDDSTSRADSAVRILALGDAYTLGAGVRTADAWPARLEARLNTDAQRTARPVKVYNCAVTGHGTADALARYADLVGTLRPDLVLLGVVLGDQTRGDDDVTVPVLALGRMDHVFRSLRWWKHRKAEATLYDSTVAALPRIRQGVAALDSAVRVNGSRFAVLVLQDHQSRSWNYLASSLQDSTSRPPLEVFSLGSRLSVLRESDRLVSPPIDLHPGHSSHRAISEAVADFLRRRGLHGDPLPIPSAMPPGQTRR